MRNEIIAACCGAVVGSGATFGGDVIKSLFLEPDDPLSAGIVELSHISKELMLEQQALNERIASLAENTAVPPEVRVEIGDIVNRVENIVQTTVKVESQSRDVAGLARSSASNNEGASYSANADLILGVGQGVTVCGNETTLGIESVNNRGSVIYLDGARKNAPVGAEFKFNSPAGPSMLSYLGKNGELLEFRIVCGTEMPE